LKNPIFSFEYFFLAVFLSFLENLIFFSMIKKSQFLLAFYSYFSSDFYVCKIGFSKAGFFLLISIVKLVTPKNF